MKISHKGGKLKVARVTKATTKAATPARKPAAKRQTRAKVAARLKKLGIPGRVDIMSAAMWIAEHTQLMPVLWGPTAVGKTYAVRELAKERNARLIVVLLQQETPDEIGGFQVYMQDKLVAQPPYWFREMEEYLSANPEGEVILFFDELDKAHDENRGALYTFIRDRHLRSRVANGKVMLIGACNPGHFPPGWESRVCFLHFPATREHLNDIAVGSSIAEFVASNASAIATTNASASELDNSPPPSPKVVDAAAIGDLMQHLNDVSFYRLSKEAQSLIISAKLPLIDAEALYRYINESLSLNPFALAQNPDILSETLKELDVPQAVALAVSVLIEIPKLTQDQEKIDALLSILDPFMADVIKLEPYYATAKPGQTLDELKNIDAELFAKIIKDSGRLRMKNKQLTGRWVDELMRQFKTQGNTPE